MLTLTLNRPRGGIAAIAAGAALALAGCSDDATVAEPEATPEQETAQTPEPEATVAAATEIVSGTTTFRLDDSVQRVLELAGIDVGATGEAARAAAGEIEIPISSGQVDLDSLSGRVEHQGGISFSAGGRTVEANRLALELDDNQVTAEVEGGRVPLLDVEYQTSEITRQGESIELPPEAVRVSDEAANLLNEQIGVDVFEGGLTLGELAVDAQQQVQDG